jgi:hypothetical protein
LTPEESPSILSRGLLRSLCFVVKVFTTNTELLTELITEEINTLITEEIHLPLATTELN